MRTADFMLAVAEALGLDYRQMQRLVIDADIKGGPVRVYVKGIVPREADAAIVRAVKDVAVVETDRGPHVVFEEGVAEPPAPEDGRGTVGRIVAAQREILDRLERG